MKFESNDRVLLLELADEKTVREYAAMVGDGALVILGEGDALYDVRAECRDVENAMFTQGTIDLIPWGVAQFHHAVLEKSTCTPNALKEIWRVLMPGGSLWLIYGAETLRFQRTS